MPGGRLDTDLEDGADEHQRGDAAVAQRGLERRADQRGHAELVEHRLPGRGRELVDDRRVRRVRRERGSSRPPPGPCAARPSPSAARRRRGGSVAATRGGSRTPGRPRRGPRSTHLRIRSTSACPIRDVRQDARLRVVDEHGDSARLAHLGDRVGNVDAEGSLHASQGGRGGFPDPAGRPPGRRRRRRVVATRAPVRSDSRATLLRLARQFVATRAPVRSDSRVSGG